MNCPWFLLRLTLPSQHLTLWYCSSNSLPSLLHPQFPLSDRSFPLASKQDVIYLTLKTNKKHFLTTTPPFFTFPLQQSSFKGLSVSLIPFSFLLFFSWSHSSQASAYTVPWKHLMVTNHFHFAKSNGHFSLPINSNWLSILEILFFSWLPRHYTLSWFPFHFTGCSFSVSLVSSSSLQPF